MANETWLYLYKISDGEFSGSIIDGYNTYDSNLFGETSTPVPAYDDMTHNAYWVDGAWEIRSI